MGPLGSFLKGILLWGIIQGNESTLPMGPLGEFFKELSFGEKFINRITDKGIRFLTVAVNCHRPFPSGELGNGRRGRQWSLWLDRQHRLTPTATWKMLQLLSPLDCWWISALWWVVHGLRSCYIMVWMGAPLIYHSIRAPIQPMRLNVTAPGLLLYQ